MDLRYVKLDDLLVGTKDNLLLERGALYLMDIYRGLNLHTTSIVIVDD
jgi:hypothetical protein